MANVNDGMHNIINLGLKKLPCPIPVYLQHLNGCTQPYRIQESKNYQWVALAQDILNNVNGHPKVLTQTQIFDFVNWFCDQQLTGNQGFMCDSEQDSLIYIGHHLRPWRVLRGVALKKGRLDVAAKLDVLLLVLLVHSACTAMPRPIKVLSTQEQTLRQGAGFFHATVPPSNFEGKFPLLAGLVGKRSFGREPSFDAGYWSWPLCESLALMPTSDDTKALRAAGYDAAWGLTARQSTVLKGIVARDIGALSEAFGWLRTIKTASECRVEWRTGGMQTWLPKSGGSSTAPVNYRGVVAGTGEQRILCACNGERNSHTGDTDVGPSSTTVSAALAFTKRDDLPAIDSDGVHHTAQCQPIGGTLIARMSWGPLGHRVLNTAGGVAGASEEDSPEILPPPVESNPVPPPVIQPPSKPKRENKWTSWI